MRSKINFDNLLISSRYDPGNVYESVEDFEYSFPCIRELEISFVLEPEDGKQRASTSSNQQNAKPAGRLSGTLILGRQAYYDGESVAVLCDDYSADLCVVATELENTEVLSDSAGVYYDILSIHSLELSQEIVDAANLREFFGRIPRFVFQHEGIMPQVCCNLIATTEGYYEEQEKRTKYDPRSAGKDSVRIFIENGYWPTQSGELLIRVYDEDSVEAKENGHDHPDEYIDFMEELSKPNQYDALSLDGEGIDFMEEPSKQQNTHRIPDDMRASSNRHILEDHVQIGINQSMALVARNAPSKLTRYVSAAIAAYDLGSTFDYALKHFSPEKRPDIPPIHLAFQEMYYAGMQHMKETQQRMNPQAEPNAGEVFSDAALSRATNTYYVAALLYREGHMIEAHAMSRLMLEQVAWSLNVFEKQNREEAEKVTPTKAISELKKKIKSVGKLYGTLSQYVHLPLKGHDEFVDLSRGKSAVLLQFGAHSYYFGQILARLADYWADIYEYTQARHFEQLENWVEGSAGLELNSNRPFLRIIEPLLENLRSIYAEQYPTYENFLESNWTISDENEGAGGIT